MNPNEVPLKKPQDAFSWGDDSVAAESTLGFDVSPPLASSVPAKIDRYEIRAVLGNGAFGRVYRALDPRLDREVAIKVPLANTISFELFLREARAVASIDHPNVCRIYDVGTIGDLPYLVMAFIPGGTLAKLMESWSQPFPALKAATLVRKIALGVAAAHEKGVLHRDLKPANVLWNENTRQVLVADFGLARIEGTSGATQTQDGRIQGSPSYMSPEQARGKRQEIGPPTDIYSLGAILYQLATGRLPFEGSVCEVLTQKQLDEPKAPSTVCTGLDSRFDAVCLKALARNPADRYQSANDFAASLVEYIRKIEQPELAPVVTVPEPGDTREIEIAPGVAMTFCWIPPGSALLGSPKAERDAVIAHYEGAQNWIGDESEEERGKKSFKGFWLGKCAVTQSEWAAVMKGALDESGKDLARPSHFRLDGDGEKALGTTRNSDRFPVENISFDHCMEFLKRVNAHGGVAKAFGKPGQFALPHEDEWEYACRGGLGNKQPFYFGRELNGTQANCDGNHPFGTRKKGRCRQCTCAVDDTNQGAYAVHPWGLQHMHGNVYEWCSNVYKLTDFRMMRGGSWNYFSLFCRAAYRNAGATNYRSKIIGFRVCIAGLD